MKCSDPICNAKATRELLGIAMCDAYYIEALEHSAHIVAVGYLAEFSELSVTNRDRCAKISETVERKRNAQHITSNQSIEQAEVPEAAPDGPPNTR